MATKLQKKTQEWMELERKTVEQRRQADEFYESNLMELIEKEYIRRNKEKVFETVDYMVISVGTSYEPIALNIQLFKPHQILFLYTEKSAKNLNKIVQYCKLEQESYEKSRISETNPLEIYREIKRSYLKWAKPEKMYIDFTGGTKAMSVASAMAGAMIDVQLVYVGSDDYLVDFRKPKPGSETLYYITNPLAVFGDLEIEKAFVLFAEHNYVGAQEKLATLKEEIPEPDIRQELNFVHLLAKIYEGWDALDFIPAYENIKQLTHQLRRDHMIHPNFLLMDFYDALKKQEQILEQLQNIPMLVAERKNMDILQDKELISALMFTMCQNALVREEQEKYDMATLLLYRLLEMIEQRRLSHYNLYVSKMNYRNLLYNKAQNPIFTKVVETEHFKVLKSTVVEIKKMLFGKNINDYLPDQVSLLEGFIILQALGDPIVYEGTKQDINHLKRIRAMVYLRNNSIFAHGLGPVGLSDFQKFKSFVLDIFQQFCKIEEIPYESYLEEITWLNPMLSVNYAPGWEAK